MAIATYFFLPTRNLHALVLLYHLFTLRPNLYLPKYPTLITVHIEKQNRIAEIDAHSLADGNSST